MLKNIRIIPRLDIKGPNLVKGIHLEGLRVLGKPEDFALKYYEDGADELLYNILAETKYGDNVLCSVIKSDNIYGCQFHPERSGEVGLEIYRQFLKRNN